LKPAELKATPNRSLFFAAMIGIFLYVLLDAVAQILPPHYSPIRQPESDLAVGPYGYIMAINFVNRGILSLCFIVAIYLSLPVSVRSHFRAGLVLLALWGVGAIILSIFPTDLAGARPTMHGEIHLIAAFVAFICGAFGTLFLSLGLQRAGSLGSLRRFALPLLLVSVVLCFVTFAGLNSPIGGLLERLFLGSVLLWILVVSLYASRSNRVSQNTLKRE
jgi:hypothetical protein